MISRILVSKSIRGYNKKEKENEKEKVEKGSHEYIKIEFSESAGAIEAHFKSKIFKQELYKCLKN